MHQLLSVLNERTQGKKNMAWVRIDDQAPRHQKFLKAGPSACWLWVCGTAHCQSQLSDGFVSDEALPMIGIPKGYKSLAGLLVKAGLWERIEGGYRVHDYLDYNKSRQEVLQKRAEDAQRKRDGESKRIPRGGTTDSARNPNGDGPDSGAPRAGVPSHPIPSALLKEPEARSAHAKPDRGAVFADDRLRIPTFLDEDLARMHPTFDRIAFYQGLSQRLGDAPIDQRGQPFFDWVKAKFCEAAKIPSPQVQARRALSTRVTPEAISHDRASREALAYFEAHGCEHSPRHDNRGQCIARVYEELQSGARKSA